MKTLSEIEKKLETIKRVSNVFFTLSTVALLCYIVLTVMTFGADVDAAMMSSRLNFIRIAFLLLVVIYIIIDSRYKFYLRKSTQAVVRQEQDLSYLKVLIDSYSRKVKWSKRIQMVCWVIIILFIISIFYTSVLELVDSEMKTATLSMSMTSISMYVVILCSSSIWIHSHLKDKLRALEDKYHGR
ncbi:hypothetical protein QYZ87_07425 [Porphyromonadaceae bacterium W3.11]|nr:hypothetical protein [Porphyromonadaceae bacterium W3.11]